MAFPSATLYPAVSGLYPGDGSEVVPTVVTGIASGITNARAVFAGTVNPNGLQAHYYFEYGLTGDYGSQTSEQIAGSGVVPVSISGTATGLLGARYYHYRLVAFSAAGFAYGEDQTFYTLVGINDSAFLGGVHDAGRSQ